MGKWKKNDKKDAEMIARIARFDKKLFYPIRHKGKKNQATLAVLKSRKYKSWLSTPLLSTSNQAVTGSNPVRGTIFTFNLCSRICYAPKGYKQL